ncbi:MAG: peroxidase family protein [Saprospiraceae bacterium]
MKRCVLVSLLVLGSVLVFSQETRTFDGTLNNPVDPTIGSAGSTMKRLAPAQYADGIGAPVERMNPRIISNLMFDQPGNINDQKGLSAFVWVFGQFIDHDITLAPDEDNETLMIRVPDGDIIGPVIPIKRSVFDPATGVTTPRQHINAITAFIDGSGIYGSNEQRANWLRTFQDGKLRTSSDDLLPLSTITGEYNSNIDPLAPFMAKLTPNDPNPTFVAGDVRANENLYLLAVHTLFVREHNRQCDLIKKQHPGWNDEQIYQLARRKVSGFIESITYNEWLPAMGVALAEYSGYQPQTNPQISNEFSAAAFRLGHTLINSQILRVDNKGQEIPQGHLSLRQAFFQPLQMITGGGLDPLFKGMATQVQQEFDCKVVNDVRNFLFGAPGQGGLDLAAINIMRGRERGLADYNTIRAAIGLQRITKFSDITAKTDVSRLLAQIYGDVNNIDPWVGMLSEDPMEGTIFGPTVNEIMRLQFSELRDGDRFFYLNDPALTPAEVTEIDQTRFSDIIKRNTTISLMQDNVFQAMPHEQIPHSGVVVAKRNLDMAIYPNPVAEEMHMKIYASHDSDCELRLINMLGQESMVRQLTLQEGENDLIVPMSGQIVPGTYLIQLRMGESINVYKISKL